MLERIGPDAEHDLEALVALADCCHPEVRRQPELVRGETVEAGPESVAHRNPSLAVEPDPHRPAIGKLRRDRAAPRHPAWEESGHPIATQRDELVERDHAALQ